MSGFVIDLRFRLVFPPVCLVWSFQLRVYISASYEAPIDFYALFNAVRASAFFNGIFDVFFSFSFTIPY